MVESLHSENVRDRRFFCGADLEAAVNDVERFCGPGLRRQLLACFGPHSGM
ncbi:hypothetical protein [Archangium lansingense]|uniref:Transposase n=1 Tax=Archangium lansingense TaxID=2995310 RepID=A0ABT4AEE8_9BACT|nr:hypothetical protein [Archangium lansinium]MCY1079686.1 hypothetical protein [Archangium lansinium]